MLIAYNGQSCKEDVSFSRSIMTPLRAERKSV